MQFNSYLVVCYIYFLEGNMKKTLTQELLEEAINILNLDGDELAYKLNLETCEMPNYKNGIKELPIISISSIASEIGIRLEKFYGNIFDTQNSDVNLLGLMKQSMKDKPFFVQVPKEALMDKKLFDRISKITSDIANEALRDENCNAVYIAYIKA